jgi:hypothetical protein
MLDFFHNSLVHETWTSQLSIDTEILPISQFDQRIGLTGGFADALDADSCLSMIGP